MNYFFNLLHYKHASVLLIIIMNLIVKSIIVIIIAKDIPQLTPFLLPAHK